MEIKFENNLDGVFKKLEELGNITEAPLIAISKNELKDYHYVLDLKEVDDSIRKEVGEDELLVVDLSMFKF